MVEVTHLFISLYCLRGLYGPDFKFASRLSICVRSQSHQFIRNASVDVREVYVASQACDGFMQQGPEHHNISNTTNFTKTVISLQNQFII